MYSHDARVHRCREDGIPVGAPIGTSTIRLLLKEAVSRDRWPRTYADLDLPNFYRYRLDRTHRMLYSIVKLGDAPAFVWIIEAMDHARYDRIFGYD